MWNGIETAGRWMLRKAAAFVQTEAAVTSIEYALIAALIAIVIVAAVTNVGMGVLALFEMVAEEIAAAI